MKQKPQEITVPEGYELVGVFKLKDKEGKSAVRVKIRGNVSEVIVQKFSGENNKVIIAIKRGDYEYVQILRPDNKEMVDINGNKIKTTT